MKLRLVDLEPPAGMPLDGLVPPPRFDRATFDGYDPQHPSQARARDALRAFASTPEPRSGLRRLLHGPRQGRGIYLDGGFGVGKTHLLAATFHAAGHDRKRYLSFQELVYLIGVLGMAGAREAFAACRLLCIDEFELDDPGNTLIVKSFLEPFFGAGGHVVTTSNTPPAAQGAGRFNAQDFQREIQSIAARFEVLPVGGPDYRERLAQGDLRPEAELDDLWNAPRGDPPHVLADFDELEAFLASVHPVRYGGTLERIGTLYLTGVRTIADQGTALRFVHFVDKLYDLQVGLEASGSIRLRELFDPRYRASAFQKKHERCLSRLAELLGAREGVARASAPVAPGLRG